MAVRPTILGVEAAVVAIWFVSAAILVTGSIPAAGHLVRAAGDGPHGGHGGRPPVVATMLALPGWVLMTLVMMLPAALPAVRHVARSSARARRGQAVMAFLAAYVALWAMFGAVALTGAALLLRAPGSIPARGDLLAAGAMGLAAAWRLAPTRARATGSHWRNAPLHRGGSGTGLGCVRLGLVYGLACVASCWTIMVAMVFVTQGHTAWMAVGTAVAGADRLILRTRRGWAAAGLGVTAASAILAMLSLAG